MILFNASNANIAWSKAAGHFKKNESLGYSESRNGPTLELLHVGFTIKNPRDRWILSRFPPINPAFALAEVVWIINGSNDANFINSWNPILPKYSGSTKEYHGAYGHRLKKHFGFDQLLRAYQSLSNNENSRQTVLQIWDAKIDFPNIKGDPVAPDIPCNVCALLKIRNNKLEWCQIMRSNDLFRGLPYNIVQFTALQEIMSGWLGVGLGTYNHLSDSLHLYVSDLDTLKILMEKNSAQINVTDSLALPYETSISYFRVLYDKMLEMIAPEISKEEFIRVFSSPIPNEAMQNILLVLGADIARRKIWPSIVEQLINNCSNLVYNQMWHNWSRHIA